MVAEKDRKEMEIFGLAIVILSATIAMWVNDKFPFAEMVLEEGFESAGPQH